MAKKIPRYRAFTIDGRLCTRCDSDTLKDLNHKIEHYPEDCNSQPVFVRDNVKEKWL